MKIEKITLLACLIFLLSCSKENLELNGSLLGTWNLVNKSGGFVGANCDYQVGDQIWVFSEAEFFATTTTTSTETACDNFFEGTFTYSILDTLDKQFLLLNGGELGRIYLSNNELTLDQNEGSRGFGADGFVYRLER